MEQAYTQFFQRYWTELGLAAGRIDQNCFAALVEALKEALARNRTIYIFGNGGSGSTAAHFACDLNKGVSYQKSHRFKVICLNDNMPTLLAYANDVSYADVFVEQLKNFLQAEELVIGVSGSGNSPNVLKAVDYANAHGGRTFGICGFGGGQLAQLAQQALVVHSNDMQQVEDLHLIVFHMVMQILCQ